MVLMAVVVLAVAVLAGMQRDLRCVKPGVVSRQDSAGTADSETREEVEDAHITIKMISDLRSTYFIKQGRSECSCFRPFSRFSHEFTRWK